jgi:hypothetical protein
VNGKKLAKRNFALIAASVSIAVVIFISLILYRTTIEVSYTNLPMNLMAMNGSNINEIQVWMELGNSSDWGERETVALSNVSMLTVHLYSSGDKIMLMTTRNANVTSPAAIIEYNFTIQKYPYIANGLEFLLGSHPALSEFDIEDYSRWQTVENIYPF